MSAKTCESCGHRADVRLPDGSTWCWACDLSARRLGYDNEPATVLGDGEGTKPNLSEKSVAAIEEMLRATYDALREDARVDGEGTKP